MKPGGSNAAWFFLGTVVLAALVVVVLRNTQSPSQQLVQKTRRAELVARIQASLAAESEAEKSAVLAVTDRDSQVYADQARNRAKDVDRDRLELEQLLEQTGTREEKDSLAEFSKDFSELQRVDAELLALAVKNTNLKASALDFGPAAEALNKMDAALSRFVAHAAESSAPNAKKEMLLAARALASAMRIDMLLPPHIAEESDSKMDQLEAEMAKQDDEVRRALKELASLLPSDPDLSAATSAYAQFSDLRRQILKLSRENTNVRSLSISLNQKRKLMLVCQDALSSLANAIAQEPVPGAPSRPR